MAQFTVKKARRYANLTQQEVAKELDICRDTYRKLEKNPEEFTIKQAKLFSKITNLPLDDIFFGTSSTLSRVS